MKKSPIVKQKIKCLLNLKEFEDKHKYSDKLKKNEFKGFCLSREIPK